MVLRIMAGYRDGHSQIKMPANTRAQCSRILTSIRITLNGASSMNDLVEFQWCAERLKALADPERLRIVRCLFEGKKNVGELAAALKSEVVKISHHLGVLRHIGIVLAEKQGRFVCYQIHPELAHELDAKNKRRSINFGCCQIELC